MQLPNRHVPTPLAPILWIAGIGSLTTGVYWHGVGFIAKHGYQFAGEHTALLYVIMGVLYMTAAFSSGRASRFLERWLPPRTQLTLNAILLAFFTAMPVVVPGPLGLWSSVSGVAILTAMFWPLLESYLTRGRHGHEMRHAVNRFNFVWMLAVALPLLFVGAILTWSTSASFAGLAGLTAVMGAICARLPRVPPSHGEPEHLGGAPAHYPTLLRAARTLLPVTYLLMAALGPVLPYRLEAIGVSLIWATPASATWLSARLIPVLLLSRSSSWHGRFSPLLWGSVSMFGGMAGVLLAPGLPYLLVSFLLFGAGAGLIYAVALYYAMAVGHADVDAGSVHEGLIGVGYAAGPALALIAGRFGGNETLVMLLGVMVSAGLLHTALQAWHVHRHRIA